MNAFRLVLCLGGFATYLVVKQFIAPGSPEAKPANPTRPVPVPVKPGKSAHEQMLATPAPLPVITHLEMRDKLVTIRAGELGPVYEVKTKDGKVLAANLSETELQAREPQLYELIQTAVGFASKDGRVVDARWKADVRSK